MSPTVTIGITVFHNPMRLRKLLQVLDHQGQLDAFGAVPVRVFQDPWDKYPEDDKMYARICRDANVEYHRLPHWSCMQGSIQFAVEHSPEDWFIYLPDDVLPAKGALDSAIKWCSTYDPAPVGAFQIPYWNADELPSPPWQHKDEMWTMDISWLAKVPRNPHWDGTAKPNTGGRPYPYVNLNGAGFALRRSTWKAVGGFSPLTWCLDEDMGAKIWLRTPQIIVTAPGPCFVHYMGGSNDHPPHEFWTKKAWLAAGWPEKDVLFDKHGIEGRDPLGLCRRAMRDRCNTIEDDDPFTLLNPWLHAWPHC
jgi:hypothetical protein